MQTIVIVDIQIMLKKLEFFEFDNKYFIAAANIIYLINPKFLANPNEGSIEIKELNIK